MLECHHQIFIGDSREPTRLPDRSVHLVVTSPPYPMIAMWDDLFQRLNPKIRDRLAAADGQMAFELMHRELDKVWLHIRRVLAHGGIACINIGDAVRKIDDSGAGRFRLYSNHSRVLKRFIELGFDVLPPVLWRKQTNAPNKFMGSGMLPCGAYVTLEHEHILIFRKGGKREFRKTEDRELRRESAYFWEERNLWFSDIWDFKGTRQDLSHPGLRDRSAAFPMELAYRLINMYSQKGDTVLDPFLGTATTTYAAMASQRHSVGMEIDPELAAASPGDTLGLRSSLNSRIADRFQAHLRYVETYGKTHDPMRYTSRHYGFPVMTRQETDILIRYLQEIRPAGDSGFIVSYCAEPSIQGPEFLF